MKTNITLYGTLACHLCEAALEIVQPLALTLGIPLTCVDIAENNALVEEYGLYIPVIATSDGTSLRWPFDAQSAKTFLSNIKS